MREYGSACVTWYRWYRGFGTLDPLCRAPPPGPAGCPFAWAIHEGQPIYIHTYIHRGILIILACPAWQQPVTKEFSNLIHLRNHPPKTFISSFLVFLWHMCVCVCVSVSYLISSCCPFLDIFCLFLLHFISKSGDQSDDQIQNGKKEQGEGFRKSSK